MRPKLLFMPPPGWNALGKGEFLSAHFETLLHGRDSFAPEEIDYFVGFRPPPGYLKSLPSLKAVFSLGAGVDGFLADPEFPRHIPLVRSLDPNLAQEMSEYVVMHVLIAHRHQRFFDAAQAEQQWRQMMLPRAAHNTRVGILGLGVIGGMTAERLAALDFPVSGWSQNRKNIPNVKSFAGTAELSDFLGGCDFLVCVLPLTAETEGIMNAAFFAALPKGAWVINIARGQHLIEQDLIDALDSGHLAGAVLDVFQDEPLPQNSPIWRHPKITATPHIAGITDPKAALTSISEGVRRAEAGEPLLNVVDMTRGY